VCNSPTALKRFGGASAPARGQRPFEEGVDLNAVAVLSKRVCGPRMTAANGIAGAAQFGVIVRGRR